MSPIIQTWARCTIGWSQNIALYSGIKFVVSSHPRDRRNLTALANSRLVSLVSTNSCAGNCLHEVSAATFRNGCSATGWKVSGNIVTKIYPVIGLSPWHFHTSTIVSLLESLLEAARDKLRDYADLRMFIFLLFLCFEVQIRRNI